jgi:hypothetical protein
MPDFTPGLQLAEHFYHELVQPLLAAEYPHLAYAAALMGSGSEVLGFDTVMSTDHHWGPRVMLFLSAEDKARYADDIKALFRARLPTQFRGYPTGFGSPDGIGVQLLDDTTQAGQVNHRIEIRTVVEFCKAFLPDYTPERAPTIIEWLQFSEQNLLELTAGAVFHDAPGTLTQLRAHLTYYPRDVWLYRMAAIWSRISQEEHFMGRTGDVGDEIGSRLLAARLVRDVMRLGFLLERKYAPYPKWFGTAFAQLTCTQELMPILTNVLNAPDWQTRETHLSQAYRYIATLHNELNITPPLATEVVSFFGRPYQVIFGGRFADALIQQVHDPEMRRIAERTRIGGSDQFSDSTDFLMDKGVRAALRHLYE